MKNEKKYYLYKMNEFTIAVLPNILLILIIGITYLINKQLIFDIWNKAIENCGLFLIALFGYLAFHEVLHSLAYVIYGGKFNKIIYGIELEKGILYCLCKQNISKNNILHSLLYPFFFIGIITYVISMIFNLPLLLCLSIVNLSGCSGDLIMFAFISRLPKDIEFSEFDDSTSFAIYSETDISKRKHFGLKYIKSSDAIERNDFEKIKVSRASKYVLIGLIVLAVLSILIDI